MYRGIISQKQPLISGNFGSLAVAEQSATRTSSAGQGMVGSVPMMVHRLTVPEVRSGNSRIPESPHTSGAGFQRYIHHDRCCHRVAT